MFPEFVISDEGRTGLEPWVKEHVAYIDQVLDTVGAVVLRGFRVDGAEEFRRAVTGVVGSPMPYIEGASPRTARGDGVYTSTEYAADLTVSLHNELSYSRCWPQRLAFYCRRPAGSGGATPVANSRNVFARLVDGPADQLRRDGVRYRREMPAQTGPGVPWPTVFGTDDRASVEAYCLEMDIDFGWLDDGGLRTQQVRPAAITHPRSGENVWFNQAHQWHPSNSGEADEAMLRELFGVHLPMNAELGNGVDLDRAALAAIRAAYAAEQVEFDWHPDDVLLIDNLLTAHGRTPFTGEREVLVTMGRPGSFDDVRTA